MKHLPKYCTNAENLPRWLGINTFFSKNSLVQLSIPVQFGKNCIPELCDLVSNCTPQVCNLKPNTTGEGGVGRYLGKCSLHPMVFGFKYPVVFGLNLS